MSSYFEGKAYDPKTGKFAGNNSFIEAHPKLNLRQISINKDFTTRYIANEEYAFDINHSYIAAYYDLDAKNIIIHTADNYCMPHYYKRKNRNNEVHIVSMPPKFHLYKYPGITDKVVYYGKLLLAYEKLNIVIIRIHPPSIKFAIYPGNIKESYADNFAVFTDITAAPTDVYMSKIDDQFVISTLQEGCKPIPIFDSMSEIATHVTTVNGTKTTPPCEIRIPDIDGDEHLSKVITGDVYRIESNYFMLIKLDTNFMILDVEMIKCPTPMRTKAALHD